MNTSLIISFINRPLGGDYWIHVEQVLPDDSTATLGELAKLVDTLYGVNPCNTLGVENTLSIDIVDGENYLHEEEAVEETTEESDQAAKKQFFKDTVKSTFTLNLCSTNVEGDYLTQVKIARSHADVDYKLNLTNGTVDSTVLVEEIFTKTYTVEKATGLQLDFPVISGAVFSWTTPVVVGGAGYRTAPDIILTGRTLSWDEPVTGALTVSYLTRYDLAAITVFGSDGQQGECRAIAFYRGLADDIALTPPDIDGDAAEFDRQNYCPTAQWKVGEGEVTCWQTVITEYKCRCSNSLAYSVSEDVETSCPAGVRCGFGLSECSKFVGTVTKFGGYVFCSGEDTVLSDPNYYEQMCCDPPAGSLPKCRETYAANTGGESLAPDILAGYQTLYGDTLKLVPVSPADGDCGYTKTTVTTLVKNCCDTVEPLEIDTENSAEVVADNSSGIVSVTGGRLPLTVSVRGSGFFLDSNRSFRDGTVNGTSFGIYTGGACGACTIAITDGCSTTTHFVRSTNGRWEVEYSGQGGVVPYTSSVTGEHVGGCPAILPGGGAGGTFSTTLFQGISGAVKISQFFINTTCTYNSSALATTFDAALVRCQEMSSSGCASVNDIPNRTAGSCFSHTPTCGECGTCSYPTGYLYYSLDPGPHTNIYQLDTDLWRAQVGWGIINNSQVERWVC